MTIIVKVVHFQEKHAWPSCTVLEIRLQTERVKPLNLHVGSQLLGQEDLLKIRICDVMYLHVNILHLYFLSFCCLDSVITLVWDHLAVSIQSHYIWDNTCLKVYFELF